MASSEEKAADHNLLFVARTRVMAKAAGIESVTRRKDRVTSRSTSRSSRAERRGAKRWIEVLQALREFRDQWA